MQKSLFYQRSFRTYLIPILLLVFSFVMYSYSLEGQPSHLDEIVYLSWGGPYFEIIQEGDFDNPCLKGLTDCELLFDPNWAGYDINYSPLRNFFVGFGYYLTTGEIKGDFYEWSCMWFPCWDPNYFPAPEDFSAGRFFSPIFGSLTIVLAFFIGKILFNRTTGLFFSLILLFYSLWLVNSRLIMTEVYLHFFIMLTIFLLLKSFKKENNHRIAYFIFGAISFGIALNIKIFAIEVVIPILVMILFYESFNEKLNFRFFKKKKNVFKAISLVLVFFMITSMTFVATVPKYHDDTLNKVLKIGNESSEVGYASLPSAEKNYLFQTLATIQVTLLPYIMDSYIHDVFYDEAQKVRLADSSPPNRSTIPLSLFFFIGLIYIIRKIKTRNLKFSELALLVWFTSVFIFVLLIVDFPTFERYYLPVMFPVMLIASYGLGRFIQQIHSQKEKILFFTSFIIAHSLYIISFFENIYFSNSYEKEGFQTSSEIALNDPLVYVSTISFLMISLLLYLRTKIGIPAKTDIPQS